MTAAITRGSVLAPDLPSTIYVDPIDHSGHTRSAGQMSDCYLPTAELHLRTGHNRGALVVRWCDVCFPGLRCKRRVTDTTGRWRSRCGQPSGAGDECRAHTREDNRLDKALERAA